MKLRIFSAFLISFATISAQALEPFSRSTLKTSAKSRAEYCQARRDLHYFTSLAHNSENLMAFENQGGLFNGGVCWWHSLFQRSALYLTVYRPELPKPNATQAKKIIYSISAGKRVVEIPGYSNFREFSHDWEKEIQKELESWQLEDGALKWAWVQGLSGSPTAAPNVIAKTVNFVITRADEAGALEYTMWQFPGITAHASINIGGIHSGNSYEVEHLDSNFPQEIRTYKWAPPARSIDQPPYSLTFVPYVHRRNDLTNFKRAQEAYCASGFHMHEFFPENRSNSLD